MRLSLLLAICAVPLLAHAQKPSPVPPTLANVAYGSDPEQVLDFYQAPGEGTKPLLFNIHGGGWLNGDKTQYLDWADNCLKSGVSLVSINYRLIKWGQQYPDGPPVKRCLDDCARALQFVRSKADEWKIDRKRIAGTGGSAGGFSILWLGFHPDMADPKSADPVARESTRVNCILAFVPQTTIDPKLMTEWVPNNDYGSHAFAVWNYQEFYKRRDEFARWYPQFSPIDLATSDDPPVYLFFDSKPAMGEPQKDPPHSANFGAGLVEKLKAVGISYEFNYPGATGVKHPDMFAFVTENLRVTKPK